jgi:hypothetical protein
LTLSPKRIASYTWHGLLVIIAFGVMVKAFELPRAGGLLAGIVLGAVPLGFALFGRTAFADRWTRWSTKVLLVPVLASVLWVVKDSFDLFFAEDGGPEERTPIATHLALLAVGSMLLLDSHFGSRVKSAADAPPDVYQSLQRTFGMPAVGLSFFAAIVAFGGYVLVLSALYPRDIPWVTMLCEKTLDREYIPPLTIVLAFWAIILLFGKLLTLRRGSQALREIQQNDQLEPQSGVGVLVGLLQSAEPKDAAPLDAAWQISSDSYLVVRYVTWAVPILGFIGTVYGIAEAVQNVRLTMGGPSSGELSENLADAIAPLGVAFDTTLVSLTLSIIIGLMLALVQRLETSLLSRIELLAKPLRLPRAANRAATPLSESSTDAYGI